MKSRLLFVFIGLIFIPLLALANKPSLFGDGTGQPKQSYHQADPSNNQASDNREDDETAQIAKVKAIMAAAKKEVQVESQNIQKNLPSTNSTVVSPVVQKKPITPVMNEDHNTAQSSQPGITDNQGVEKQLSQLNQLNLLYEQQTDQKIENLSNKNNLLKDRIDKLQNVLVLLNQEVNQMNNRLLTFQAQLNGNQPSLAISAGNVLQNVENELRSVNVQYAVYAVLLMFVISIVLFSGWGKKKKPKKKLATHKDIAEDTEDEYDFMNTDEAIPAKLNLARSYFAMEDFESARTVLDEILKRGDASQKKEAQNLISKIPGNS